MTSRETYITKMKLQLDELNLQMNKLEAKAQEVREEMRDTYRAEMNQLQGLSQQAMAKLEELQTTSENTWDAMVQEADKIRDAFVHSCRYFKSQV